MRLDLTRVRIQPGEPIQQFTGCFLQRLGGRSRIGKEAVDRQMHPLHDLKEDHRILRPGLAVDAAQGNSVVPA